MKLLENYRNLVARVDLLCSRIVREYCRDIACRKGCDECCTHFTISWIEAINLSVSVMSLPAEQASCIRRRAEAMSRNEACPLLLDGSCLLYESRPIICRTHGLPILLRMNGSQMIDFCPKNFQRSDTLPGSAVIDLDQLNEMMAAVNALFVSGYFQGNVPPVERPTIADALLWKI